MNFMESLAPFLQMEYLGNTLQAYGVAAILCCGLFLGLNLFKKIVISRLLALAKKTPGDFDDFVVGLLAQVGTPVFLTASLYMATQPLVMADFLRQGIKYLLIIAVTIRATFILQDIVRYGVRAVYAPKIKPGDPSGEAMVKSVSGILKWVIWLLAAIFVLDNLGINISALVAGIGIGGIAVAMASQAVLGDAFSAASIFLDKPFEIGDFIIVDDMMGTVEHIGIKTTRIRSLGGEQLVFSNADLTTHRIRNYKRMNTRRIVFGFGVIYQTPIDKVRRIPGIIQEIFGGIDGVRLDRAHFKQFGASSLDYEVVYFVLSSDFNVYMDKQQAINFAIMDAFAKEGIDFAYPTQTLYVNSMNPAVS